MPRKPSTSGRSGFTLVELLVVIGIIALLISILLPSLNRARQYANLIKCQSNLRQIGMAVRVYASENQDYAPWGDAPGVPALMSDGSTGTGTSIYYAKWPETLSAMLSGEDRNEDYGMAGVVQLRPRILPIFQDTDTLPGGVRHYTANIRVFGDRQFEDPYRVTVLGRPAGRLASRFHPARLSSLNPSSEIASVWCGNQTSINATAPGTHPINIAAAATTSRYLDQSAVVVKPDKGYLVRELIDPEFAEEGVNVPEAGQDRVGTPGPSSGIRTRHMNNTTVNLLFVDGHVESKVYSELKRKLFVVPAPK